MEVALEEKLIICTDGSDAHLINALLADGWKIKSYPDACPVVTDIKSNGDLKISFAIPVVLVKKQ